MRTCRVHRHTRSNVTLDRHTRQLDLFSEPIHAPSNSTQPTHDLADPAPAAMQQQRETTAVGVDAAASTFGAAAAATPGQQLLQALARTTPGRLQRYEGTTAARQSKSRSSIPHSPHHALRNELCQSPCHEVHQLLATAPSSPQRSMAGVRAMLQSKAQRHEAAWARYEQRKAAALDAHAAAAAAAASQLKAQLAVLTAGIERDMAVLAEDRVMVLDEQQLTQVWQGVETQRAPATACIDALAAGLEAAEAALTRSMQDALQEATAVMTDVAHLDEGRLQRLVEQEATAFNMQLLDNRRDAAGVLQQLHAGEVLQEQARRTRWASAVTAWRTLRSTHAVQCFCKRVGSDLAEPDARLALFRDLRASQAAAHDRLVGLLAQLPQLTPPRLSSQTVAQWVAQAQAWGEAWQQQLAGHMQQLRAQENEVEQQVQAGHAALRTEVLSYRGLTEQQVDELLRRETAPVICSRREAAQQLLQDADRFLHRQAAEWRLAAGAIGSWLSSLVSLFEDHKARTGQAEVAFKAGLRAAQEQFEGEDAAREAALEAATLLLSQGSDEQELDARLEAALQALDAIAGGYRSYAAAAIATARAHPGQVAGSCDLAFKCLCGLLHAQPQTQTHPAGEGADALAGQGCSIQVPGGGTYDLPHDLWGALLGATPKPWLEEARHQLQRQHQQQQRAMDGGCEGSEAAAAAVPAAKPAAAAGKMTKQQLAEAAAAEEAAQEAAAAAAAAEAEAAALAAAAASPPCPADSHGGALCLCLPVPDAVVQEGLQQMQVCMLQEAEAFGARSRGGAETLSEPVEALLTEQLDSRLRAHRPRAGRIEEEVHVQRSSELMSQRRHFESHMKAQEKAVVAQQGAVDAAVLALRADAASWRAKLLDCERLLGESLSSKGLDICLRQTQALRSKLGKQLELRVQELQVLVERSCDAVVAASTQYEAEHLKSFDEGGKLADASLASFKTSLSALHTHMAAQQQRQQEQLAALAAQLADSLSSALATIEGLLPSHKQDMALVELLAANVEGVRRKVAAALHSNCEAAERLDGVLQQLQESVSGLRAAEQPRGDAAGECQRLLACMDQLRLQLVRQAQVLMLLQPSAAVSGQAISLNTTSELCPLPGTASSSSSSTAGGGQAAGMAAPPPRVGTPRSADGGSRAQASSPAKGAGKAPATKPGSAAGKHGSKQAAASGAQGLSSRPATANAAADAQALAQHVSALVDAAKQEVASAAKAYFAAKEPGRPIRFASKIAPSLQELSASTDAVFSSLQAMLQEHMATATKQLRVQVVQAYRLLERAPGVAADLLMQHLLAAAAEQQRQLLVGFGHERAEVERQLEQHKHALHPSMLHISRRAALEALKAAEASRQQAAAQLTASCSAAFLELISSQARQLHGATAGLTALLVAVVDGTVLPADLVPAPEGDDSLSGLQRLSLEELERLACVQQAAAPTSTGGRGGASVSWQLPEVRTTVSGLGWTEAEAAQAGSCSGAAVPAPAAAGRAATGAPAATAQPHGGGKQPDSQPAVPSTMVTAQRDSLCARAAVLAHTAAVQRMEAALSAALQAFKGRVSRLWGAERQWADAWAAQLRDMI